MALTTRQVSAEKQKAARDAKKQLRKELKEKAQADIRAQYEEQILGPIQRLANRTPRDIVTDVQDHALPKIPPPLVDAHPGDVLLLGGLLVTVKAVDGDNVAVTFHEDASGKVQWVERKDLKDHGVLPLVDHTRAMALARELIKELDKVNYGPTTVPYRAVAEIIRILNDPGC